MSSYVSITAQAVRCFPPHCPAAADPIICTALPQKPVLFMRTTPRQPHGSYILIHIRLRGIYYAFFHADADSAIYTALPPLPDQAYTPHPGSPADHNIIYQNVISPYDASAPAPDGVSSALPVCNIQQMPPPAVQRSVSMISDMT